MVSTDDSKSFSPGSNPSRATPKLIVMIKLNENYVVTPTGAKTLIIEEGDDWNKVCELEVSLIISLYLKNLRIKPAIFFRK